MPLGRPALHAALLIATVMFGACGGRSSASDAERPISAAGAVATLNSTVLTQEDLGAGFARDVELVQTNDSAAAARPDTDNARRQYADWGQIVSYNVQYAAIYESDLVYTGKVARVMNTATLFRTDAGASSSMAFERSLSSAVIANILVNDGPGARISETQVIKDIAFPAKGDESFAWRLSGKATLESGLVTTFVADAVFVRQGHATGDVVAVAFGEQPDRDMLSGLVDRFVEHAAAAQR